jgi:hypothetical protein
MAGEEVGQGTGIGSPASRLEGERVYLESQRTRVRLHLGAWGTHESDRDTGPLQAGGEIECGEDGPRAAALMENLKDAKRHRRGRWMGSRVDW